MAPLQTLLRDLGSCRKSIFICLISNNHRKHSDSDRRDRTLTLKALSTDQCKNAATTVERGSPAHNHLINARSYHVSASLTFQQGRGKVDKVGGRAQAPSQYFLSGILPLSSAFNSSSPTPPLPLPLRLSVILVCHCLISSRSIGAITFTSSLICICHAHNCSK